MAKIINKGKAGAWGKRPVQKLTDDYTGGPLYSDNVEYDYKGNIVNRGLADPTPRDMFPVEYPVEITPPIIRTEGANVLTARAAAWDEYWDTFSTTGQFNEYWDLSEFEY